MPDTFDAIIIGTGFGATVAASALRAKKKRVLMLERGLWYFTPERPIPPYIQKRSNLWNSGRDPIIVTAYSTLPRWHALISRRIGGQS